MISLCQEGKSSPARFGGARVQTLGFFTACVGLSAVLPIKLEPDFHLLALQGSRGETECKYYDGDSEGTLPFARMIRCDLQQFPGAGRMLNHYEPSRISFERQPYFIKLFDGFESDAASPAYASRSEARI
jgi:hypothetical protein